MEKLGRRCDGGTAHDGTERGRAPERREWRSRLELCEASGDDGGAPSRENGGERVARGGARRERRCSGGDRRPGTRVKLVGNARCGALVIGKTAAALVD